MESPSIDASLPSDSPRRGCSHSKSPVQGVLEGGRTNDKVQATSRLRQGFQVEEDETPSPSKTR